MRELSLYKITAAVGGKLKGKYNNIKINDVATDSRKRDLSGALFVALPGERFDGHDFVREAIYKGAACILSERELDTSHPVIIVPSTRAALLDLAAYYRSLFDLHVVAVTGSVGKTVTKDMTAQVLSTKYKTLKTEGNLNNAIGLPTTVFKLDESYQAAVFELGMSRPGEVRELGRVAQPTVAVITNIGDAHSENFDGREQILAAKAELLEHLTERGHTVLNGDDELLKAFGAGRNRTRYFGAGPGCDYTASNIKSNGLIGVSCTIKYGESQFKANIPLPGGHMVYNALAAAAAGDILGISEAGIKSGLESVRPSKMRMDILNAPNGVTVINDAYNASPASVVAGLDVLSGVESRKVCILGDMLELGEKSGALHGEIGAYAASRGIDLIICVGENSAATYGAASANAGGASRQIYFKTQDDLLAALDGLTREGDTVLVKASRGMEFEKTVAALMEGGGV